MADGKVRISVQLGEEQKERWEDHVEDHPVFNNLSSYIRHSVEEQIKRDSDEN